MHSKPRGIGRFRVSAACLVFASCAAEAATQDETPAKESGDKPVATVEGEPSVAEIESRITTEDGDKAVTKEKVKQKAAEKEEEGEGKAFSGDWRGR